MSKLNSLRAAGVITVFVGLCLVCNVAQAAPAPGLSWGKDDTGADYPIKTLQGDGKWTISGAGGVIVPAGWSMPNRTVTMEAKDTATNEIFSAAGIAAGTPPSTWGVLQIKDLTAGRTYKVTAKATFRKNADNTDHTFSTSEATIAP